MAKTEPYLEDIEAYLSGTMSEQERTAFQSRLDSDGALADAFSDYQLSQSAIEYHLEQTLHAQMDQWERMEKKGWRRYMLPSLVIAASILLLAIGYYLLREAPAEPLPPKAVAEKFYEGPPPIENQAGSVQEVWAEAREAYRLGHHVEVTELLSPIENRDAEMNYYLAQSYLAAGQFDQAEDLFRELSQGNSIYNFRSDWYLLLTLLQVEGDAKAVNEQIQKIISEPRHPYYQKTQDLSALLD